MKFLDELEKILKADERFIGEDNQVIKTKVSDAARGTDALLIKSLLKNELMRESFFTKVDDVYVFDKVKFIWVLDSKEFLPDSYTFYKNKIGLVDNQNNLISQKQDVSLVWPYKDCVLEGGQTKEDQKREEIFYNETLAPDEVNRLLAPKVLGNAKRYTADGIKENIEFQDDDNLIIKGNNLLGLSSILEKYEGKIKCVYIDPPYNTGSDSFGYNDRFNRSSWLTFMKNRLELAKKLLTDDGVIFVQCDDNEQAYLKVLMDSIFENGFVTTIVVQMSIVQGEKVRAAKNGNVVKNGEYIHVYSKDGHKNIAKQLLYDPAEYDTHYSIFIEDDGNEIKLTDFCMQNEEVRRLLELAGLSSRSKLSIENLARAYNEIEVFREFIHGYSHQIARTHTMIEVDEDLLIDDPVPDKTYKLTTKSRDYYYGYNKSGKIHQRILLSEKLRECDDYYNKYQSSTIRGDWWSGFYLDMGNINKESVISLDDGQKPERLIQNLFKMVTEENDIILDFFSGSGTSSAVAHKMNRQYIGIEQLESQMELIIKRLKNVIDGETTGISKVVDWQGGGSFVYCELLEDNQHLINEIQDATDSKTIKSVLSKATDNGKILPTVLPDDLNYTEDEFDQLCLEEQKALVLELLDKNKLYINLSDIDDEDANVSEADKAFTKSFYGFD